MLTSFSSTISELTNISRKDIHSRMAEMRSALKLLHNNVILLQCMRRGLGTQWKQEPVTLEDALGMHIRLPLEVVNSWDAW